MQASTKFSRITPEQAQAYIPVEEDVMNSEARFYTITPHRDIVKRTEGWEEVTYYTGRRKVMKITPSVDKQHVYLTPLCLVFLKSVILKEILIKEYRN